MSVSGSGEADESQSEPELISWPDLAGGGGELERRSRCGRVCDRVGGAQPDRHRICDGAGGGEAD